MEHQRDVWCLPVPSTAFLGAGASFAECLGREIRLTFSYEGDDDSVTVVTIAFCGVEAFKCTYFSAADASVVMAYDKVISTRGSEWLEGARLNLKRRGIDSAGLEHFMITFDDGPTYECLARSIRIDQDVDAKGA